MNNNGQDEIKYYPVICRSLTTLDVKRWFGWKKLLLTKAPIVSKWKLRK